MRLESSLARLCAAAVMPLCWLSIALLTGDANAASAYIDGDAPPVFHTVVVGDFESGLQGWREQRLGGGGGGQTELQAVGGVLQGLEPLGTNGESDGYVFLNFSSSPLPGVPDKVKVGELPGQYDIVQFDLRFDTLPPEDPLNPGSGFIDPRIRGRQFFQVGVTHGVNFFDNAHMQNLVDTSDHNFHTYTIQRDFNDAAWEVEVGRLRIDMLDGVPKVDVASLLGTEFSIDNVKIGRTTATEAFPAITTVPTNIIRNGDLSDTSNVVLGGTSTAAFDINGGNGNYGPFRGNTGDVDHWTPYNNNPNSIVEAVADGGALDLLNLAGDRQGSFYLDTHWSTGAEQFSLNSAGGYLNGMIQTDILNGVTIDDSATYEFAFDINFNNRDSNPNSTFTVALTLGEDETDPNSTGAVSLFDAQLSNIDISTENRQVVSLSGATLKAAQDSGQPVNLILQSLNTTAINNFPGGTPVPNDHADGQVVSQTQVDNLALIKLFDIPTGDVNKDGVVSQADVNLAQDYLDGNGGETAAKRQNDLAAAPSFPLQADILASLNLTDFDLTGNDFFDADDVAAIADLVVVVAGDYNGNGQVEQGDLDLVLLNWGKDWPPEVAGWINDQPTDGKIDQNDLDGVLLKWGNTAAVAASSAAVPEPASALLIIIAALFAPRRWYRRRVG